MRPVVLFIIGMAALGVGLASAAEPPAPTALQTAEAGVELAVATNVAEGGGPAPITTSYLPLPESSAPYHASDNDYLTWSDFESRLADLAWQKNGFRIVPYGSLWGSAIYNTRRTFPEPYTLYVLPLDEEGEPSFVLDTRRTRLGLDIDGPLLGVCGDIKTGGNVEIDFHGAFVVENKPGVLLRHAYGEVWNDQFRLLAGQTWDVISPLRPGTLNYSALWAQGNIGYRRAQVRYERYVKLPHDQSLALQTSLNQNIVSDFAAEPGVETESSAWPLIQGRMALRDDTPGWLAGPVTLGVSGHIGEQGWDFTTVGPPPINLPPADDVRIRTWSFNVDLRVPVSKRAGFQGEYFMGENLSTFLGGIVQGVCPCLRRPIRSHGGWVELWYDWSPCLHSRVGYGVDDPNDNDMLFGRTYNHLLYSNVTYDVTKHIVVGFEVSLAKTSFKETRPGEPIPISGESVGFEFSGQYNF